MLTYTGCHVTKEYGAPNLRDIAVQTMRIVRFGGAGRIFWPVGMHLLLVADLVPKGVEHHALLHDAAECIVADVPRPMKTTEAKCVERWVTERIYASLGLRLPTEAETAMVHHADILAVNAEGLCTGIPGFRQAQPGLDVMSAGHIAAVKTLEAYLDGFNPVDCINESGYWPGALETRLREAVHRVHKTSNVTYTKDYTNNS